MVERVKFVLAVAVLLEGWELAASNYRYTAGFYPISPERADVIIDPFNAAEELPVEITLSLDSGRLEGQ